MTYPHTIHLSFTTDASTDLRIAQSSPDPFVGSVAYHRGQVWLPISTAPDLDRVMVCGWQNARGGTIGYWYYGEDVPFAGKGDMHPDALYWTPLVIPPFPPAPNGGE